MSNFEGQIFYENNVEFKILPSMANVAEFREYIINLKNTHMVNNSDRFFWEYNEINNSITVNEKTDVVDNNIFYQLAIIILWLFEKNYSLSGSFCYRIGDKVEYVSTDHNKKIIKHYLLVDNLDINENSSNEKIMLETKKRMMQHIHETESKHIDGTELKYIDAMECSSENTNMILRTFQERLVMIERKIKSIVDKNDNFIWKFLVGITMVTAFSFLTYFAITGGGSNSVKIGNMVGNMIVVM